MTQTKQTEESCCCGGKIKNNKTFYIRGFRMAAFPSHPCDKCSLLYWEDTTPVQCHNDGNPVLAFMTKNSHEFREVSEDFLAKMTP